jgi:hypothetical protein
VLLRAIGSADRRATIHAPPTNALQAQWNSISSGGITGAEPGAEYGRERGEH